jgi:hypothetical protein
MVDGGRVIMPAAVYQPSPRRLPESLAPLYYPFSDCYRVSADGSIRWNRARLFVSTALAGELIGVNQLDARYAQVAFANVLLGLIDCQHPQLGLIRPRDDLRRANRTRIRREAEYAHHHPDRGFASGRLGLSVGRPAT